MCYFLQLICGINMLPLHTKSLPGGTRHASFVKKRSHKCTSLMFIASKKSTSVSKIAKIFKYLFHSTLK